LALALEECASNVVNHALQRDARKTFSVKFQHSRNSLVIELRDAGPEFDPAAVIVDKTDKDDLPGGWGIQLVRRYTDRIQYKRQGGENVLRLTKKLLAE
jgi:anti-sigma regulatory factor (Ser/Thr protein kinase)